MRRTLALVAALALAAPTPSVAADPPIVFQTQSVGRVLDDARTLIGFAAGDKAVKEFNDELKRTFGEKGLDGLDLSRPVVGYSVLAPKIEQSATVFAVPVTNEKDFLDLIERANKQKPKALAGGLYELPKSEFADKALLRVVGDYAYICLANDPTPHLDPKAIVAANTLYDPNELSLGCVKLYPERLPKEVTAVAKQMIDEAKKFLAMPPGGGRPGMQELMLFPFAKGFLGVGEMALAAGGDLKEAALRLNLDPVTADMVAEIRLTPKAGTLIEKAFAARTPTSNRFGALLTPDTVGGVKLQLPLFTEDLRKSLVDGLEEFKKTASMGAAQAGKAASDEFFNGFIRAAKAGDVDLAVGVRGPDAAGALTGVGALAFEDGAAFEKAFKKFVDTEKPPANGDSVKWDVAKVGAVSIHEWKLAPGGFFDITKPFGGAKCSIAFAFAPKGLFLVIGPDAVAVIKDVVAVKPALSPAMDVVVNPARLVKTIGIVGDPMAAMKAEEVLGKDDKLQSAASLTVTGGKDLRVTLKMGAKTFPKLIMGMGTRAEATFEPVNPGIKK